MASDSIPKHPAGSALPLAAALALLTALTGATPAAEQAEGGENAIRKLLQDQQDAWNRGDLNGFMAGYWRSDQLTFYSGGNRTRGWDATLERYRKRYQSEGQEMGKLTFSELRVELLGPDSAFVRGRFELVRTKDKPSGIFTLVLRRFPEGWRIVHDHTST
jgi:beta-aspartyl-peptidase (threonine type)